MNSSTLISLYQQPEQCSDEQLQVLSTFAAKHPYMTFAKVLQQKISQEKNPKFNRADQQKTSILLSPDSLTSFFYLTEVVDAEQILNQTNALVSIQFNSGMYIVELANSTFKSFLLSLCQSDFEVKYIRDISQSSRRLFTS